MDQIKIEVDMEIKEALFQVVQNILQTGEFKVRAEPGSKKGDNFVGVVYRIIFSASDEKQTSNLFLKVAPIDKIQRKHFHTRDCFLREIYVYGKVLPYFREFEESRSIDERDGFHEYSMFYKSIDTELKECLFLQDLSRDNFAMVDKKAVTVEHILLVMKTLGKSHALSFALRNQQPEKFAEIISGLQETLFLHGYNQHLATLFNMAEMNVINSINDDQDAHLLDAVLRIYERNQFDIVVECVDGNACEPYSVVAHGDLWSNNTMFQCNEKNWPNNTCIIDWQMCRYASPALDILYYIFCSTTKELRGRNYNVYLKTYHESLSNHLLRLGSNAEKLFPFKVLQEQLIKFGKFGLANASFALPIMMEESILAPVDNAAKDDVPLLSDAFKIRLRDIVADMYVLGYI